VSAAALRALLQPVEEQARRIAGIKAGADLVVNARIDVDIRGGARRGAQPPR
jgi:hypothetical protein